jgi:Cu(I)/Ag(I) efflux system membrane fusion protein
MLLAGMNEEQVRQIEAGTKVQPRFTLHAPIGGVIAELGARDGMTLMAGATLFRINGLGSVWVYAEIPESRTALIRPGNNVEVRTPAFAERVFKGRVAAILPEVNPATRTIKARVEVANSGGVLTPGMFATIDFAPTTQAAVLLVPSEAVIQTGARKVVIAQLDDGKFQPTDVATGTEANGQIEIRKGLTAGQKVVISSQFLIDSESNLKNTTARMSDAPTAKNATAKIYRGEGKIEALGKGAVTISHGPIASLQWGAMTMDFKIPAAGLPKTVTPGNAVTFEFKQRNDGEFELTSIAPAAHAQPHAKAKAP